MKKNSIYIIVLVIVGAIAAFIFINKNQPEPKDADKDFTVKNIEQVSKIFMADKNNKEVTLIKHGDYWMVNETYKVFQHKIDMLLQTLKTQKVRRPVSKAEWNNVVPVLASSSTKVEVFTNNPDVPEKVFYVGHETVEGVGTFMVMKVNGKTAERPYVVYIPGFGGGLSARYFLDENDWRDLTVYDYTIDEIKWVEAIYPDQPYNTFKLTADGGNVYTISNPEATSNIVNAAIAGQYLNSFSFLNAEVAVNNHSQKDTILSGEPAVIVSVGTTNGEINTIKVYRMPVNKRSKTFYDAMGNEVPFDKDRFFALINNEKDFVIIQNFVFARVFRRYSDFVKAE